MRRLGLGNGELQVAGEGFGEDGGREGVEFGGSNWVFHTRPVIPGLVFGERDIGGAPL
jgi:hypothetical protein